MKKELITFCPCCEAEVKFEEKFPRPWEKYPPISQRDCQCYQCNTDNE